ncbi:hypothetical protein K443DRAFT_117221 [Laccaria amethystina LaAM-08-1]|uniref:Uncharacterized protein n=1 Tax=Laccaria amethystina LaAM-08-1 TaxID=1095629 RepID=A0A0C9X0C4_9AGAR|nr:hypothetical protein K443DRAFT_117221 [Laccaria amethystina LaAM-08-1]
MEIIPVWYELKTIIRGLHYPPNTTQQLIAAVHDAWETLPIPDVDKHIVRMSHRVEAILAAKGGHTRF